MNKKIITLLTIASVVIIIGTIGYITIFAGNKQNQSQLKNNTIENIVPKIATKLNNKTCVAAGKTYYPPKESCCEGLTTIFGSELPDGKCFCTEKNNDCGGAPTCAPCGNKKCEKEYKEDKCNCPVDCK